MSLFKDIKERIKLNKKIKEGGGFVGIPITFPRLSNYIPVIERGHSIGVLGATGSGKSRFVRYVFIYEVYKFYKLTGYPVKIVYLPLEDNKEKVYRNIICHYLKDVHNVSITLQELDSKGERHLPEFVADLLDEAEEYFEEFEKVVTVLDGENEPTKIYEMCKEIALDLGEVEQFYTTLPSGKQKKQYRYNSPVHVICVVDNLSNVDPEEGVMVEHSAINKFAKEFVRGKLCNFFGWTVVQVLQLDFESEKQSFNKDGHTIISKLEPSLSGIGDSKRVARSMHLIIGLFAPSRYDILRFPIPPKNNPTAYYDIETLGNRFRSMRILKSNDTDVGMRIGLLFDGISETFTELPPPGTEEMQPIYNKIKNKGEYVPIKHHMNTPSTDILFNEEPTPF